MCAVWMGEGLHQSHHSRSWLPINQSIVTDLSTSDNINTIKCVGRECGGWMERKRNAHTNIYRYIYKKKEATTQYNSISHSTQERLAVLYF